MPIKLVQDAIEPPYAYVYEQYLHCIVGGTKTLPRQVALDQDQQYSFQSTKSAVHHHIVTTTIL